MTRRTMTGSENRHAGRHRHGMPIEGVTGSMLKEMVGPNDRHYAISAPTLNAEEVVIHGQVYAYECHSGLRVHATDTLEAHDLAIDVDTDARISVAVFLEGRLDLKIGSKHVGLGGGIEPSGHIWTLTKPSTFRRASKRGMHVRKVIISVPPAWMAEALAGSTPDDERLKKFVRTHGAVFDWSPSKRAIALAAQVLNPPTSSNVIRQIYVESHAIEIVAEAMATLAEAGDALANDKTSVRDLSRAGQIRAYVLENINAELTLNGIAKELGLSVPSMQRAFKSAYGGTVIDFIREVRLHQARQAIDKEGISVSEAAYRAGYSSPANFSTAFKKLFGMTPSQAKG